MKALLSCLAGFAVLLSACSEPAPPEAPEAAEAGAAETHTSGTPDEQAEIEAGLYPAVMIEGEVRPSLAERMAHFNAPQVSVAVWRDGALDWAEGYGEGADADTLFQAKDAEVVLERFEEEYESSLIPRKFVLDTTTASAKETLVEFRRRVREHLPVTDPLRMAHRPGSRQETQ